MKSFRALASSLRGRSRTMGEKGTFRFAHGRHPVSRVALVNHLVTLYGLERYLEIGVRRRADMLERVLASHKVGVDPNPDAEADHILTSDAFFAQNEERFDLIFIDGLHTGEQVERDIANALDALSPGGFILLHDLNPATAFHAREVYEVDGTFPTWNGTSWKGFVAFRRTRPDLEMHVIDTDFGVGLVRVGRQRLYEGPAEDYAHLEADRQRMLSLISVRDFLRRHPVRPLPWTPFDRWLA